MKTKTLIIISSVVVALVFVMLFYILTNDNNSAFTSGYPQIPQNDMFCWTQWYMKNTVIDEAKLIQSIGSAITLFGSNFDISNREITISHNNEETIISISGSWAKDKIHHEKLTSVIQDHIGDSKIIRDDFIMCT
jgi:hypothetical protein